MNRWVGLTLTVYCYVDTNKNGLQDPVGAGGDSYVIEFANGSFDKGQWNQALFDSSVNVHVVGNRDGLGACDFSSSCGGGLLGVLDATTDPWGGTWGDATVWRAYVVRKCLSRLAHTFIRGEFCNYLTGLGGKPLPEATFAERDRCNFLKELH